MQTNVNKDCIHTRIELSGETECKVFQQTKLMSGARSGEIIDTVNWEHGWWNSRVDGTQQWTKRKTFEGFLLLSLYPLIGTTMIKRSNTFGKPIFFAQILAVANSVVKSQPLVTQRPHPAESAHLTVRIPPYADVGARCE